MSYRAISDCAVAVDELHAHLVVLAICVGGWLVFAWGTFAIVELRNRAHAKHDSTTGGDTSPQLRNNTAPDRVSRANEGLDHSARDGERSLDADR